MQQMPQTPEELQALFESLIAAGKVPQEVLDRMEAGEKFQLRVTPQGLALAPADAPANVGEAEPGAASAPPPAAPSPAQRLAPARPRPPAASPAAAPAQQPSAPARPPGAPKPGRNDPCPCGSGVKYKKCCAPAFG
jgi:hypothetical protein